MDNNCLSCDAGKTAASEGATSCDACAAGSFAQYKAHSPSLAILVLLVDSLPMLSKSQ